MASIKAWRSVGAAAVVATVLGACATTEPEPTPRVTQEQTARKAQIKNRGKAPGTARGGEAAAGAGAATAPSGGATAGSGASSAGTGVAVAAPALTADEAKDYRVAYDLYVKGEYENAIQSLKAFQSKYASDAHNPQIENLLGLSFLLTHRATDAIGHFQTALKNSASSPAFGQYLLYNLAKAQYDAGQAPESEETLGRINAEGLDKENRVKFHYLKASLFQKKGLPYEASRELLAASRLAPSPLPADVRTNLAASLDQTLGKIEATSQLADLYRDFEDSPLADAVLFKLGSREYSKGESAQGEIHLQTLVRRFPESAYATQATALMQSSENNKFPVEANVVGVLLPLKGKAARFGQRSLQGIELAFRIFGPAGPGGADAPKITLAIEDSGDEPEQAVQALRRLVSKHHVAAVIGPFLSKGLDQVSKQAQELHVPLLPLATHTGVPGDYVISAGVTNQQQAYELARYAIQKQGFKRFAILAPRDRFFEEFYQHFWDAVEGLGGKVVGFETYSEGETDFKQVIDKLAGLYYTEARQHELNELAKLREANQIRKRTRKTEQYYNLPAVADFDAVFIPDLPKTAGLIPNFFRFRDLDNVEYLGLSAWDSPEFPQKAGALADRAVFVDSLFLGSTAPEVRNYIERYRKVFGQEPTSTDAIAYDAARLLEVALREAGGGSNRSDVARALRGIKDHPGVTGRITYQDGQFTRDLQKLTFRNGQVTEIGPEGMPTPEPKVNAAPSQKGEAAGGANGKPVKSGRGR